MKIQRPKLSSNIVQDGVIISSEKMIKDNALKKILKNDEIHTIKAKALSDLCTQPKKNEHYRIITEKQFNAYALIKNLIENSTIDELYIAIYRINEPTVKSIINLIDSRKIKKAGFVISNFFNQTKKPQKWAIELKKYAENNHNVTHTYTHNHAKIVLCKVQNDYYVFEGSGNMSDNARIEQYVYENCELTYNFHKEWMDKILK